MPGSSSERRAASALVAGCNDARACTTTRPTGVSTGAVAVTYELGSPARADSSTVMAGTAGCAGTA